MRDDYNDTCVLISTVETSVNGVLTVTETTVTRFCKLIQNIHTVKTEAGTTGIGYEIKIGLPDIAEYNFEKFVEYHGDRYEVTRTYQDGYAIELTCQRGVR